MNLLSLLATGKAVSKDTHDLVQVNEIAKILGIQFNGWELGSSSSDTDCKDVAETTKKEQVDKSK